MKHLDKFNKVYAKIIMEMNGQLPEGEDISLIKSRVADLFKVSPTDDEFISWNESLWNKSTKELNFNFPSFETKIYNRIWEIYEEHEANSCEEASWLAINECSDEELLNSWKSFIDLKLKK